MTTGESETVLYSDVDLGYLDSVREQIPVSKQKRHDVYQLVEKGSHWMWLLIFMCYGNNVVVICSMQCIVVLCKYPAGLCFFPCNLLFSNKVFYSESIVLMGSFQTINKCNNFQTKRLYLCTILSILLMKPLCFSQSTHSPENISVGWVCTHSLWGFFIIFPHPESLGMIQAVCLNTLSTLLLLCLKSETILSWCCNADAIMLRIHDLIICFPLSAPGVSQGLSLSHCYD